MRSVLLLRLQSIEHPAKHFDRVRCHTARPCTAYSMPNPPCGNVPYLRRSRYQSNASSGNPCLNLFQQVFKVVRPLAATDHFAITSEASTSTHSARSGLSGSGSCKCLHRRRVTMDHYRAIKLVR